MLITKSFINFDHTFHFFFPPLTGALPPLGGLASNSLYYSSQMMSSAGVLQAAPLILIGVGSSASLSSAFFLISTKTYALRSARTVLPYSYPPAFRYFLSAEVFSTRSVVFCLCSSDSWKTWSSQHNLTLFWYYSIFAFNLSTFPLSSLVSFATFCSGVSSTTSAASSSSYLPLPLAAFPPFLSFAALASSSSLRFLSSSSAIFLAASSCSFRRRASSSFLARSSSSFFSFSSSFLVLTLFEVLFGFFFSFFC